MVSQRRPKVLLVQPPVEDFYHTEARLQPLGLAYLKSAVMANVPGADVRILDSHHRCGRRSIPLPKELRDLRRFYPCPDNSPFGAFYTYYHFGMESGEISSIIEKEKPDLVGISSLFSAYAKGALSVAEAIRARSAVPILFGGAHPSAVPEQVLAHPSVSLVIRGAGERPLVELLRRWPPADGPSRLPAPSLLSQVPNLGFKEKGRAVWNPVEPNFPFGQLPVPDFSDWTPDCYSLDGRPLAMVCTSRGCPQGCRFCTVYQVFGSRVERRPVAEQAAEILQRFREGYRVIDFEDDHFAGNRQETLELCRRLWEELPRGELRLVAMNGISHWHLDAELLQWMHRAGFRSLNLSLVSADEKVCRAMGRPGSRAAFREVVCEAHRLGFQVTAYQILGLPGEPMESILDTLRLLARLPVRLGPSPFYPLPGADLCRGRSAFSEEELTRCRLTAFSVETEDCSRAHVYTLFLTARVINFLKGLTLKTEETPLAELLDSADAGAGRESLGLRLLQVLLRERKLYAGGPRGMQPLPQFDADLFFRIWDDLGVVMTQNGQRLVL